MFQHSFTYALMISPVGNCAPPKSDACREVLPVFNTNLQRAQDLVEIPGYATMLNEAGNRAMEKAHQEVIGKPSGYTDDPEKNRRIRELYEKYMPEIMEYMTSEKAGYTAWGRMGHVTPHTVMVLGRDAEAGGRLDRILKSLLGGVIIQTWTAYESMAEDLHVAARKKHPSSFSPSAIKGEYYFRSEKTLIDAYKKAFNDSAINAAVWNPDSKALAMLRHLLIHKRGIVDDQFIKQCAGKNKPGKVVNPVVTDFLTNKEGDEIPIDGKLVFSLVDRLMTAGYKLISTVDGWLK